MSTNQVSEIEKARKLGLARQYDAALRVLGTILLREPHDVDALRLKGNLLDLQAADQELPQSSQNRRLQVERARQCYMRVLEIDRHDGQAMKDLGDSWLEEDPESAAEYYARAAAEFDTGVASASTRDELIEAMEGHIDALERLGRNEEGALARKRLEELRQRD